MFMLKPWKNRNTYIWHKKTQLDNLVSFCPGWHFLWSQQTATGTCQQRTKHLLFSVEFFLGTNFEAEFIKIGLFICQEVFSWSENSTPHWFKNYINYFTQVLLAYFNYKFTYTIFPLHKFTQHIVKFAFCLLRLFVLIWHWEILNFIHCRWHFFWRAGFQRFKKRGFGDTIRKKNHIKIST